MSQSPNPKLPAIPKEFKYENLSGLEYEIVMPLQSDQSQLSSSGVHKELKYETALSSTPSVQTSQYPGLQTNRDVPLSTAADAKKITIKLAMHLEAHLKELLEIDFGSVTEQLAPGQISYLRESSKINTMLRGYDKRVILMGLYLAYPDKIHSYLDNLAKRGKPSLTELFDDFKENETLLKKIFNSKYYDLLHYELDPFCQKDFSDYIKTLSQAKLPTLIVREMKAQIVRIPNLYPLKNEKEQTYHYYIIRLDKLLGKGTFSQVFEAWQLDTDSGRVKRSLNSSGKLQSPEKWVAKLQETTSSDNPTVLSALSRERYIQTRTQSPVAYRTTQPKTENGELIQARGDTVDVICIVRPDIAGAGAGAGAGFRADLVWAKTLRNPRISLSERLAILLMVANDLLKAHHFNIVHTDVKPSNIGILFSNDPNNKTGKAHAQLYDWESSLDLNNLPFAQEDNGDSDALRQTDEVRGSGTYSPPETFKEQYSTRSDIFSFAYIWIILLSVGFDVKRFLSKRTCDSSFNVSEAQRELLPDKLFPNQENLVCPKGFLRNQMIHIINTMGDGERVSRRYSSASLVQILTSLHIIISSAAELTGPEHTNARKVIQFRELAKVLLLSSHIWAKNTSYDYDMWNFAAYPETCETICRLAINDHLNDFNLRKLFRHENMLRILPDESRAFVINTKLSPDDEEDTRGPIKKIQIPSSWLMFPARKQLKLTEFESIDFNPKWSAQKQAQYIKRAARVKPLLLFQIPTQSMTGAVNKLLDDLKDNYWKSLALALHPQSNKLEPGDPALSSLTDALKILSLPGITHVDQSKNPTAVYLLLQPEYAEKLWADDNKGEKAMFDVRVRWVDIFNYLTKEGKNLVEHFGQKYHTLLKEVIDYTKIFLEEVKLHLSEKTVLFIPLEEKEKLRPRLTERTGEQINHLLTATGTALQAGFLFLLEPAQQRIYLSLHQQKANRSAIFDYLTTSRELLGNIFFMNREKYDSVLEMVMPAGPGDSKGTPMSESLRLKTALLYANGDLLERFYPKAKESKSSAEFGKDLDSTVLASCPKNFDGLYDSATGTLEDRDIFTLLLSKISDIPLVFQKLPEVNHQKAAIRNLLLEERLIYRRDMFINAFGNAKYDAVCKEISQSALKEKYSLTEKMCRDFNQLIPRSIPSLVEQLTPGQILFFAEDEEAHGLAVMVLSNPKPIKSYLEKLREQHPEKFQAMCAVLEKKSKRLQELFNETYADVHKQVTDFVSKVGQFSEPSGQKKLSLDSKLNPITPTPETDVHSRKAAFMSRTKQPSELYKQKTLAELLSIYGKGRLPKEDQPPHPASEPEILTGTKSKRQNPRGRSFSM